MTHQQNPFPPSCLRIILVETETPGNLGASARAMKSMGLNHLRLVKPKRRYGSEAMGRAVHAQDVLKSAQEYETLAEAIADCGLVLGTRGKPSKLDLPCYHPRTAMRLAWEAETLVSTTTTLAETAAFPAVVFGREARGLTRAELALCHAHIYIPTTATCPSLNLASALQILAYEHAQLRVEPPASSQDVSASLLASSAQRQHTLTQLEELATAVGVLDPEQPRQLMQRLGELLNRAQPRSSELGILQNVIGRALETLRSLKSP